ncbi:thymidine phosphorylase [Candidatus Pacearchaeota archaeon]|nr:thymidine phosphorylase [Candidatus Pacearchaeota archaeon]
MRLKTKFLDWSTGFPVAMLNQKTADKLGVNTGDRITIHVSLKEPREVSTITNTTTKLVGVGEVALSSELRKQLGLKIKRKVEINLSPTPKSLNFIKKKLNKEPLSQAEINEIIKDIVNNSLYESEIALFISAMYKQGMSTKETIYLTKAILNSGNRLGLKNKFIADKHGIGGIPGNRTTPIIVSICAAGGLIMPKSSSRAITSAAGTADVMETITNIEFSMSDLKKIVKKTNACLVWGGALGMVPADSKIIRIEKMLKIDPEAQLLASIMAKKLAVGSKYIVIGIPYGKTAKVNKVGALKLKKKFEYLGKYFNRKLKVIMTKEEGPIGNSVGPALELRDVIRVLDPEKEGPKYLEEKSLLFAGQLLEMTGKAKKRKGIKLAKEILSSGKAFKKFEQIIKAQGGKMIEIKPAKYRKNILAKKPCKIYEMHNKKINSLARVVGCPTDKFAGLYFHKKKGDKIKKGEKILTIYAESRSRLNQAVKFFKKEKPIRIR